MKNTILVTGAAGFIGSAVARHLLEQTDVTVVNVDSLTYAGNQATFTELLAHDRYSFEKADICDEQAMAELFERYQPKAIMHLAAESHVDRSIDGPKAFIQTNIVGTYILLEAARAYWLGLNDCDQNCFRFHQVSTDEVFGSLGADDFFTEESQYQPNSPYSASKASSDHLARAWHETFGLPVVLSNCSNNYGPYQFPEKLIPVIISKALSGAAIPIYGKGDNIRDWLYVGDHASALVTIMTSGQVGRSYNVGGNEEKTNLEVVAAVCEELDRIRPKVDGTKHADQIEFVKDRPGHDQRYAIDPTRIRTELNWQPSETFESGIAKTVAWYLNNDEWISQVTSENYDGSRLGQG